MKKLYTLFLIFFLSIQCWAAITVTIAPGTLPNGLCKESIKTFTCNVSGGTGTITYQWKLDGINVGTNNPNYDYSATTLGSHTVKVEVIQGADLGSSQITFTVHPIPIADFSIIPASQSVCSGEHVDFINNVSPQPSGQTAYWDFSGSTIYPTSNSWQTSSYRYWDLPAATTSPQIKPITLTVTISSTGCQSVLIKNVTVNPIPTMSNGSKSICSGENVAFGLSSSIPTASFKWKALDNGNVNGESTTWKNSPTINDVLTLLSGVNSPEQVSYKVIPISNGCEGSEKTITVTVFPTPAMPTLTVNPVEYCKNEISIPLTATGNNLQWYNNQVGGIAIAAPTPVTSTVDNFSYYVTQTAFYFSPSFYSCESQRKKVDIIVNPLPLADFTFPSTINCANIPILFTNTSTSGTIPPNPNTLTYLWDFGTSPNNTTTEKDSTHTFFSAIGNLTQTFNVKLITTNIHGCKDEEIKAVTVNQIPDASLSDYVSSIPFTNCSPAGVSYLYNLEVTNTSSTFSTNTGYQIDWGNPSPTIENFTNLTFPNSTSKTHTYPDLGPYSLIYTVNGSNGCYNTKIYPIFNGGNPSISMGNPGGTSACIPPNATYSFPITYTNILGQQNTPGTQYTITVNDNANSVFSYSHPVTGSPQPNFLHTFNTVSCGTTSISGSNTYLNSFLVTIVATNPCGSSSATVAPINISEKAQGDFNISPVKPGCITPYTTFTFTNNTNPPCFINPNYSTNNSYKRNWIITPATGWSIISGSLGNNPPNNNPSTWGSDILKVTFNQHGNYDITFIAENSCEPFTKTKTICVSPIPIPSFTIDSTSACLPYVFNITNTTNETNFCPVILPDNLYSWEITYLENLCDGAALTGGYSFTGATNSHSKNPKINFTKPGKYKITLTVNNYCPAQYAEQTIIVKDKPFIQSLSLTPTAPYCLGDNICADAVVKDCYGTTATTYNWTSTLGSFSNPNQLNPGCITASSLNNQSITLNASNECGTTTKIETFNVVPLPVVTAQVSEASICIGGSSVLSLVTPPTGTFYYQWQQSTSCAGPWMTIGTTNSLTFSSTNPGTYYFQCIVSQDPAMNVCPGTSNCVSVIVLPDPVTNIIPDNPTVCMGGNVTFTANTSGGLASGYTYQWQQSTDCNTGIWTDIVSSNSSTYTTPNLTSGMCYRCVVKQGNTEQNCEVISECECVTILPIPSVDQPTDFVYCNGDATTIINFTGTGTSYDWTNNNTSIGLAANGTGDIVSFTATNSGTTPVVATITVTPKYTNGGVTCSGTPKTFTITVNPTPSVDQPSDLIYCNGDATTIINFTGTGTSYDWTNNNTSIGLIAGGTGNIPSFTATNSGTTTVVATITVTPNYTFGGKTCSGTPKIFTITVNPSPNVQFSESDQVICSGDNTTLVNLSSSTSGATITWSCTSPLGINGTSPNGTTIIPVQNLDNLTNSPIPVVYIATANTTGSLVCPGLPTNYTITVNPIPIVNQPLDLVYCNGDATTIINFTGTGTSYDWTNNNTSIGLIVGGTGNIPSFTATNSGTTTVVATITVTPNYTFGGKTCSGTPKIFTITVNPSPNVQFSESDQVICSGDNTTLVNLSSSTSGATITWSCTPPIGINGTSPNGTTIIPVQNLDNLTNSPIPVVYIATANTTGSLVCPGLPTNYTITVNPIPIVNQPLDLVYCNGDATAIISYTGTGTSYDWTNNNTSIGLAANGTGDIVSFTAINTGATPVVATITVTPKYTFGGKTCSGTPKFFTITVNPTPSVDQTIDFVYCNGDATTIINFTGTGTSYDWTNNNTSIGLAANGTGNIVSFTAINTGATPVVATITVTPNYTFGGKTCQGTPKFFTITVNPTPSVDQTIDFVYCNGDATTIINFTGTGTSYDWTNNNTSIGLAANGTGDIVSFTATNSGSTPVVATITVTPKYTFGGKTCSGTPKIFTITVNPTPTVDQTIDFVYCNGDATTIINFTGTGTSYDWTNNNTSIGLIAGGTGNIPSFTATNSGTTTVVATITVTPKYTFGGKTCSGTPKIFTITVNPSPNVQFSELDQVICSGDNTTLVNLSSSTSGATITWSCTSPLGINGTSPNGTTIIPVQNLDNTTNSPITVVYVSTASTSGSLTCPGLPTNYNITVNPIPSVDQPTDLVYCNGDQTALIVFTGTGTSYDWSNNNTSIGLAANGTGDIVSFTATNSGSTPVVATITVTPKYTFGGKTCSGTPKTFTITVNPTPTIDQPTDLVYCNGDQTALIVFTGTGTSYDWSNNNTSIGLAANGTGDIVSFTATNSGSTPVVATITVTPKYTFGGKTCSGTPQIFTITVNPTPSVNQPLDLVYCNGDATTIINFTGTGTSYEWTNNNTSIGLAANGTGDIVSFTATNSGSTPVVATITVTPKYTFGGKTCSGTPKAFTITVNPTPTVDQPTDLVYCNGDATTIINFTGTGTSYDWSNNNTSIGLAANGTGDIVSFTAINTGATPVVATITITPKYTFGGLTCPGTPKIFTITVNPIPHIVNPIGLNSPICSGQTATLTFSVTGNPTYIKIVWGDGTDYTLGTPCTPPPNPPGPAIPGPFNISHIYNNPTPSPVVYPITIFICNECGIDQEQLSITVNPISVVANFNMAPSISGCVNQPVNFTDASTQGVISRTWNFDDPQGTTNSIIGGNITNLSHSFGTSGNHNVTLTVTGVCPSNPGGAQVSNTISHSINIYPNPTPNFTFNDYPCSRTEEVTFNPIGSGTGFKWSFNGDPPPQQPNIHKFNAYGTFPVTLEMDNGNNCKNSITKDVHVLYTPLPVFTIDNPIGCHPLSTGITNSTDESYGNAHTWAWEMNNPYSNPYSSHTPPNQTFNNSPNIPGCPDKIYYPYLIAKYDHLVPLPPPNDLKICSDKLIKPVIVHPTPEAVITASDSCSFDYPKLVNFGIDASLSSCFVDTDWKLNGILMGTAPNISLTLPQNAPGTDIIELTAKQYYDNNTITCSHTSHFSFVTYPPWENTLTIDPTQGCDPLLVNFNLSDPNINYWIWPDFPNNNYNFSNTSNSYTYSNPNNNMAIQNYTVKVKVDGLSGCKDSITLPDIITVFPRAKAIFTAEHSPNPLDIYNVILTNLSVNASIYHWEYGDNGPGSDITDSIHTHSYLSLNNYMIYLTANNIYNCPATDSFLIKLEKLWGLYLPNAFSPGYIGPESDVIANFKAIGVGLMEYNLQVFDRWGNKIWETSELDQDRSPAKGWDGTYKGVPLPQGTYTWKASAKFIDGNIWPGIKQENGEYKPYGTVTIIR